MCLTSYRDQTQTYIDDDEAFIDYRDKGSGEKAEKDKGCRCGLCSQPHNNLSKKFLMNLAYTAHLFYQQNMYKQDYFRKKTISEEWIYSMSTSFQQMPKVKL